MLALEQWSRLRVAYLQQTNRGDEALRLQKQLAANRELSVSTDIAG